MTYRLLIVDDDEANNYPTKLFLEDNGYSVDTVTSGKQAIDLIRADRREYALILMDYDMPEKDGAETSREILAIKPKQQIAMYTCHDVIDVVKMTLHSGMVAFFEKQMPPDAFLKRVAELCAKYERTAKPVAGGSASTEAEKLIQSVGYVGRAPLLAEVASKVITYAPLEQTVIISGESGTGKELAAQALHKLSTRRSGHFVAVNCTAMPETLLESLLFGHEKGAFTSATTNHVGKFTLANHGTLFLDEIGDMPLALQAKLLRVLQEKVVEPLGSNTPRPVDVRVVTATHKNLAELVAKGLFRQDLFYRLNVLEIRIPPLRDRPEDIELLVAHFTNEFVRANGPQKHFEASTLPVLRGYHWPGNVRELKNVVDRHLASTPGRSVGVDDLENSLFFSTPPKGIREIEEQYKEAVRDLIKRTLAQSSSKTEAARKLGMTPSKFNYYENHF